MSGTRRQTPTSTVAVVPMKPRRTMLAVLSTAFAVWVAVLIALYFTTVRPVRLERPQASPVLSR